MRRDTSHVLEKCIALLEQQRRKETVRPVTVISPLFEWEKTGVGHNPPDFGP